MRARETPAEDSPFKNAVEKEFKRIGSKKLPWFIQDLFKFFFSEGLFLKYPKMPNRMEKKIKEQKNLLLIKT